MFAFPIFGIVDFYRLNRLGELVFHGNRYPLPALRRFDAVSVLPLVFFVLNSVKETENIGFNKLVKIAEPRQVLRLVNGNDQLSDAPVIIKIGFDISLPAEPLRTSIR